MGACREGYDLTNKFGRLHWNKKTWKQKPWRLMFEDTFMQYVCKIIGHDKYNAGDSDEIEMACKRCHKWL